MSIAESMPRFVERGVVNPMPVGTRCEELEDFFFSDLKLVGF
jgi:hypothetical protein